MASHDAEEKEKAAKYLCRGDGELHPFLSGVPLSSPPRVTSL